MKLIRTCTISSALDSYRSCYSTYSMEEHVVWMNLWNRYGGRGSHHIHESAMAVYRIILMSLLGCDMVAGYTPYAGA